jgi:hypothetical protein
MLALDFGLSSHAHFSHPFRREVRIRPLAVSQFAKETSSLCFNRCHGVDGGFCAKALEPANMIARQIVTRTQRINDFAASNGEASTLNRTL